MTSYEELTPEMRAQVDNTSRLIAEDHHWADGGWLSEESLRERIAECVMTCVGIATEKPKPPTPINEGDISKKTPYWHCTRGYM